MKSGDTGNGVSFHSGDNVTMDLEPQTVGVSFIDRAMQLVNVDFLLVSTQHIF